jgi:hypothetical protein
MRALSWRLIVERSHPKEVAGRLEGRGRAHRDHLFFAADFFAAAPGRHSGFR